MRGQSSLPDPNALFADRMRLVREYRKMSHDHLGGLTGLHRLVVGRIERQKRTASVGEAVLIATALRVPLLDLLSAEPLVLHEEVHLP